MGEIEKNLDPFRDDSRGTSHVQIHNESDTASIVLVARVVERKSFAAVKFMAVDLSR